MSTDTIPFVPSHNKLPLSKTRGRPAVGGGVYHAFLPLLAGSLLGPRLLGGKGAAFGGLLKGWAQGSRQRGKFGAGLRTLVVNAAKAAHKHAPGLRKSRTVITPKIIRKPAPFGLAKLGVPKAQVANIAGLFDEYGHAANIATLGGGPRAARAYQFLTGRGPTRVNIPPGGDPAGDLVATPLNQALKYGGLVTLPAVAGGAATFRSKRLSDKRKHQIYKGLMIGGLGLAGLSAGLGTAAALRGWRIRHLSKPAFVRAAKKNPQNLPSAEPGLGKETIDEIKDLYNAGKPSLLKPVLAAPVLAGLGTTAGTYHYQRDLKEQRRPLTAKEFLKRHTFGNKEQQERLKMMYPGMKMLFAGNSWGA